MILGNFGWDQRNGPKDEFWSDMKSQGVPKPSREVVEHCFGLALMDDKLKLTLVHSTSSIQKCPKLK